MCMAPGMTCWVCWNYKVGETVYITMGTSIWALFEYTDVGSANMEPLLGLCSGDMTGS